MAECSIFNKDFYSDSKSKVFSFKKVQNLIPAFNSAESGVWHPIVIKNEDSSAKFCDPLVEAGLDNITAFSPCNCADNQIAAVNSAFYRDTKTANLNCDYCGDHTVEWQLYDVNGASSADVLGDEGKFQADCCGGGCDVRFKNDDFLPKIPLLNQSYMSGFYDFKNLTEKFPACSNPGLGFDGFITADKFDSFSTYGGEGVKFHIDWKLKETIDEIEYEQMSSQHINEFTHEKSFKKSEKVSTTCGNFIMITGMPSYIEEYTDLYVTGVFGTSRDIPATGDFTRPYGFENNTYNNIFVAGKKVASHWKWNYQSGILGWYRYYDIDRKNDKRPIPEIDLYISKGDVFWAKNDGPEISQKLSSEDSSTSSDKIKDCPSGLKVVDGTTFKGIIPHESEFVYISENIYHKFYKFYERYSILGLTHDEAFRLSTIMATSPLYDQYTVDLLHPDDAGYTVFNNYQQIDELNRDMLTQTDSTTYTGLDFIEDIESLGLTLYYKYGGYLFIPPQTNGSLSFKTDQSAKSVAVDMDFDIVVDQKSILRKYKTKTVKNGQVSPEITSCQEVSATKQYYYDQTIEAGEATLKTVVSDKYRYQSSCSDGEETTYDFAAYADIRLNDKVFVSKPVHSGAYILTNQYARVSTSPNSNATCNDCGANSSFYLVEDAESELCTPPAAAEGQARDDSKTFCYDILSNFLNNSEGPDAEPGQRPRRTLVDGTFYDYRRYKALAFNPHVDVVAFHEQGGVFYNATTFGSNQTVGFDKNINNNNNITDFKVSFNTKDVGIKIYDLAVEELQSNDRSSYICRRFPIEIGSDCKCYGLNLSHYGDRSETCEAQNRTHYQSSSFYIPNLSTKNSPKIQYYGGYKADEIEDLFGIPVNAGNIGSNLPNIDSRLDPEEPYSCNKSYSINLTNYSTMTYKMKLLNFSNSHADVYATVSEPIDYTAPSMNLVFDGQYEEYVTNYSFKRFLNKVTISHASSSQDIYNGQTADIKDVNSDLTIKLTNPFLAKIANDQAIAMPTGDQCAAIGGSHIIVDNVRGDETSNVTITFTQKPRKQLLTFNLNAGGIYDTTNMSSAYFSPDAGISAAPVTSSEGFGEADKIVIPTIEEDGSVNYAGIIDTLTPGRAAEWEDTNIWYTDLNAKISNILNEISEFNIHKKPRIYLHYGSDAYVLDLDNNYGYTKDNVDYVSTPKLFEYCLGIDKSKNVPCLLPLVPKENIEFNLATQKYHSVVGEIVNLYGEEHIKIPGDGLYTLIGELPKIFHFKTGQHGIDSIEEFASSAALLVWPAVDFTDPLRNFQWSKYELVAGDYVAIDSVVDGERTTDYFLYKGINRYSSKNYVSVGDNPNLLYDKSNLDLDYSNIADDGYVYGSQKSIGGFRGLSLPSFRIPLTGNSYSQDIFNNGDPNTATHIVDTVWENKKLFVEIYDEAGRKVNSSYTGRKKVKIFTYIKPYRKLLPQAITIENGKRLYSIALYDEGINPLFFTMYDRAVSTDPDKLLSNIDTVTKWGDLLEYDHTIFNNPFAGSNKNARLPFTDYDNIFFKQIVNDNSNIAKFLFIDPDSNIVSMSIQYPKYSISQKYNHVFNKEQKFDLPLNSYHNYIPLLSVAGKPPLLPIKPNMTVKTSALLRVNTKPAIPPAKSNTFVIKADSRAEGAFVPPKDKDFFTPTLRIDDPLFWLKRTVRKDERSNRGDARTYFEPKNMKTFSSSFDPGSVFSQETKKRESAYHIKNIYADLDSPEPCEQQASYATGKCRITTAGRKTLTAHYGIGKPRFRKNVEKQPIEMSLGYDAGLWNAIGDPRYISIKRSELPYINPIEHEFSCSDQAPVPNYRKGPLSPNYQSYLSNLDDVTHSKDVENMDLHANEMLFRILYGEKQIINRKQLFKDNKVLSKNDLINFTDPKVTPKDVYEEILYNYDSNSSKNLTVNGTLNILGTKQIGDNMTVRVGDVTLNLSIALDATTGNVLLEGNLGDKEISSKIYAGQYKAKSLVTQHWLSVAMVATPTAPECGVEGYVKGGNPSLRTPENRPPPEPPSPEDEDVSYELVSERVFEDEAESIYPEPVAPASFGMDFQCLPEDGYLRDFCGQPFWGNGIDLWTPRFGGSVKGSNGPTRCASSGPLLGATRLTGTGFDYARIYRTSIIPSYCPATKPYDPYSYGYCRISPAEDWEECSECKNYEGIEGRHNFTYKFEDCDYDFELYGHTYRMKFSDPDLTPFSPCDGKEIGEELTEEEMEMLDDHNWGMDIGYSWDTNVTPADEEGEPFSENFRCLDIKHEMYGLAVPPYCPDGFSCDQHGIAVRLSDGYQFPRPGEYCPITDPIGIRRGCFPQTCTWARPIPPCTQWTMQGGNEYTTRVWAKTRSYAVKPYAPSSCAESFITINYTSDRITVTVPDAKAVSSNVDPEYQTGQSVSSKSYCVPLDLKNNCPEIDVSFSNNKYRITENLDTSCGTDCHADADIEIEEQALSFDTKDYTAVCVVGYYSYFQPGGEGVHMTYVATRYAGDEICGGTGGSLGTMCDGTGGPWHICQNPEVLTRGGNHHNFHGHNTWHGPTVVICDSTPTHPISGPNAHLQYKLWKDRLERRYNKTLAGSIYWQQNPDGHYNYYSNEHSCQVQTEVPVDNIFEGVIPGTCKLNFKSFTRDIEACQLKAYPKSIECKSWPAHYYVAYLTYTYRTTASSQTTQRSESGQEGEDGVLFVDPILGNQPEVLSAGPIRNCQFNQFPERFAVTNWAGSRVSMPATFVLASPTYSKEACDDGLSCYNINADDKQTVCDKADWMCWGYQDYRYAYNFLDKLYPDEGWGN